MSDFNGALPYGPAPNYGSPAVEAWRPLVAANASNLPIEFLLAWVGVESAGNPCSFTSLQEAGIFQLMQGDNMNQGGTTMAQQHPVPPCVSGSQTSSSFSALTSQQASDQVTGGVQYVQYCQGFASTALMVNGYNWDTSTADFWSMVKMVHVAPAVITAMLQDGLSGNGGPVDNWADLIPFVTGVPSSWISNAQVVGQYGAGFQGSLLGGLGGGNLLLAAAVGLGLWYALS